MIRLFVERSPEARKRFGWSNSTFNLRIKDGLMTTGISLGDRAVGWLEHESIAVLAAMVADKSNGEIKALVSALIKDRKNALKVFSQIDQWTEETTKAGRQAINQ